MYQHLECTNFMLLYSSHQNPTVALHFILNEGYQHSQYL